MIHLPFTLIIWSGNAFQPHFRRPHSGGLTPTAPCSSRPIFFGSVNLFFLNILNILYFVLRPVWSGRDIFSLFSLSSYSHLTGPVIGLCFRQSSILLYAWRTNQALGGAYKDPDVTRVRESVCFSFVGSPTSAVVLLLILVVVFLCLAFFFVKLYCSFAVTRASVYPSLFKSFSTCSDGSSSACHVTYIVLHAG